MLRILIARHGETDWNKAGRFLGQSDVGLNRAGWRQAAALARRLAHEDIQAIYTSDLPRAQETARIIHSQFSCELCEDPDLREISYGAWEGITDHEIRQQDPQVLAVWEADWERQAPPGGERLAELEQRVRTFLEKIRAGDDERTVLIVAHGGPLQVLICHVLGLSGRMYWQFHLSNASLSELRVTSAGGVLMCLNDTCYLEE